MATPERPVYLIKYAASGMPLHPGWDGNTWRGTEQLTSGKNFYPGTGPDDENRGTLYVTMMEQFTSGLDALRKNGDTPVIRGMVWMQGEQDSKHEQSASTYANSLRQLRARVAEDLGLKPAALPFAFGLVLPKGGGKKFVGVEIIHQQMRAADQDSGAPEAIPSCKLVDTTGFSMRNDNVHFDSAGQIALGRGLAQAIRELNASK